MSYELTLTYGDRSAIDFIGDRYPHGVELWDLLTECGTDADDVFEDWEDTGGITFYVPEHIAWEIKNLIGPGPWELFSDAFCENLNNFLERIV